MDAVTITEAERKSAIKVLTDLMREALKVAAEHEREADRHMKAKELADASIARYRSTIADLSPHETIIASTAITEKHVIAVPKNPPISTASSHKERYGKWVVVAFDALRLAGGRGTFPELRKVAAENNLAPGVDSAMNSLRSTLHGLAQRGKIVFEPGQDGKGGTFISTTNEK